VLGFIAGTIFISCSNDIEIVYEITAESGMPAFMVEELETFYSDSGIVKVKIYAPKLVRYDNKDASFDEYPEGINVEFFDANLNTTATLDCQYAKYHIKEELWEAKNNVEIVNIEKGESLNTELLFWDLRNERIYSDKFVRIKTEKEILFGQGFESNQEFSKWRIIKPTGTILIEEDE
jgi:LPS export ABC transporter protein LptC